MIKFSKRVENLTGLKFGKIKVLSFVKINEKREAVWKCLCDCGNESIITAKVLKVKKHCGCETSELLSKANRKPLGESCKNAIMLNYKWNAEQKKLAFDLTKEKMTELFLGNCYYCGDEPNNNNFLKKIYLGIFYIMA